MSIKSEHRTLNATHGHIHPARNPGEAAGSDASPVAFVAGPYVVEGSIHQAGRTGDMRMDSLMEAEDSSSGEGEAAKHRGNLVDMDRGNEIVEEDKVPIALLGGIEEPPGASRIVLVAEIVVLSGSVIESRNRRVF